MQFAWFVTLATWASQSRSFWIEIPKSLSCEEDSISLPLILYIIDLSFVKKFYHPFSRVSRSLGPLKSSLNIQDPQARVLVTTIPDILLHRTRPGAIQTFVITLDNLTELPQPNSCMIKLKGKAHSRSLFIILQKFNSCRKTADYCGKPITYM